MYHPWPSDSIVVEVDVSIYCVSLYNEALPSSFVNISPSSFELYNEMVYGSPQPPSNSSETLPLFKQYVAILLIEKLDSKISTISVGSTNVSS